ncbi:MULTISPECIES: phage minor head protein [Caproicibacterium]|uniref:Phage minor head protein n=1 Tax=Caproicibacterium argilliputei TaxID=3030016 RepID=A0AA97DA82_9FIRM|nr:phage minor head protein [Caproicibacterium argilliputei]WOC33470.1 phage minor head protein [Caproicibacterium argilliputei]
MILLHTAVNKAADPQQEALQRIRRFLDTWEPTVKRVVVGGRDENNASYKDIRTALLSGEIPQQLFLQWQQKYAMYVVDALQPVWDAAFESAAKEVENSREGFLFDSFAPAVKKWTENRAADFVTSCSLETKKGIKAALKRTVYHEEIGVDELAKVIRPMIGLTRPQVVANQNYYNRLLGSNVKPRKAAEQAIRYAERQHRYRAQMIARTETAMAYNQAEYEVIRQAQRAGYMGHTVKIWCTAADERTCSTCHSLDGKRCEVKSDFTLQVKIKDDLLASSTIGRVPPAHPHCRCTLLYEEVEEPDLSYISSTQLSETSSKKITQITDETIEDIPLVQVPGYSKQECIEIQKQHKILLRESKENNAGHEVSFAFSKDFSRIEKSFGSEKDAYANISGLGEDVFVMHNHPRNSSYSTQDLTFLISNDEVKVLTIVTNSGKIEALVKTDSYDKEKTITMFIRIFNPLLDNRSKNTYNKAVAKFIAKASKEGLLQWITSIS